MTRPDWCDEATWEKVENLPICGDGYPDQDDYETIARAILAAKEEERERCAQLAERSSGMTDYDIEPEAAVAESVTAKRIAAAIRGIG